MNARTLSIILKQEAAEDDALREAVADLRSRGHTVDVRVMWEAGDAGRFATEAASNGVDVVVAGGGDGTLNEVANALSGAGFLGRCALGVLPLGTANDFAVACNIPIDDPLAALRLAAEATPTRIDLGRMNERLFVNAASGGYGAEVTAQTPPGAKKFLGGLSYLLAGLAHLGDLTAHPTRVTAPGFEWEGALVGFTVGNGRQAGGGFKVTPRALLDDGLLDVVLFPEVPLQALGALAKDLLGPATDAPYQHLITCQAPWVAFEVVEPIQVNLDGEPAQSTSFHFGVHDERLAICLPPSAPLQSGVPG